MRKNFDFVDIDDYASDMDELASSAGHIIDAQRREIKELKMLVAALIKSAGGKIKVWNSTLYSLDETKITRWSDVANDTIIFQVQSGSS